MAVFIEYEIFINDVTTRVPESFSSECDDYKWNLSR